MDRAGGGTPLRGRPTKPVEVGANGPSTPGPVGGMILKVA
jgi:hypothetical protein